MAVEGGVRSGGDERCTLLWQESKAPTNVGGWIQYSKVKIHELLIEVLRSDGILRGHPLARYGALRGWRTIAWQSHNADVHPNKAFLQATVTKQDTKAVACAVTEGCS